MKKICTLFFLLSSHLSNAQNIFMNPDFEQFTLCPTMNGELQNANNWIDVVYSCDYMNCAFQGWTTQAVPGAQNGTGYAGFATYGNANGSAEAFGQLLSTPLIAGNSYRISFFAKRSDSGFYSSICTGVCMYGFIGNPVAGGAQTGICAGTLPGAIMLGCSDTVIDVLWQPYTIDFIAPASIDFIVLTPGCALNCAEYIYIDNLSFLEMINYDNVCFGDTTIFTMNDTTSMVSASWTFSDPASGINNSSSLFNPTHVFTSTGTFLVRVIRTYVNTFVDTVIIPVTIHPQVSVNLGSDTTICQGQSITLNAGGPGITNYLWQDGTSASTFIADTSGIYFVNVSNPGCSASDTLSLNVISCTSVIALFQSADSLICPGTCTDFNNLSLNATSYLWSFPGANPSVSTDVNPSGICYNTPGSYDVQLIASDGLTSDTLLFQNYVTVYPYPPAQGILQSGDSLIANQGSVSYQWYFNGSLIPGATNYFYIAPQSGDYNVVCTDANNCEVEAVIFGVIAAINPVPGSEAVEIYPNPAGDMLMIHSEKWIDHVQIINVLGECVLSIPVDKSHAAIDVHSLSQGIYWMEVGMTKKTIRKKFLKQ